jgi:hypothetical protein
MRWPAIEAESSGVADEDEEEADEPQESMLPLTAAPAEAAPRAWWQFPRLGAHR